MREKLNPEKKKKPKLVNMENYDEVKKVKINVKLAYKEKERLVFLLREFMDVFTWSY